MDIIAGLGVGLMAIIWGIICLAIPIFLLFLAWRAIKALEACARYQHDAVVALRELVALKSKEENTL